MRTFGHGVTPWLQSLACYSAFVAELAATLGQLTGASSYAERAAFRDFQQEKGA
jgi:hypothetical protein